MMERIRKNEFPVKVGKKEDLHNLDEYQVRYIDYPEHVDYIARKIDENMGSIEDTDPLVIGLGAKKAIGSDRSRIGGRHTQKGILKSKHAVDIHVIYIYNVMYIYICIYIYIYTSIYIYVYIYI